jgi:hypothetical protein
LRRQAKGIGPGSIESFGEGLEAKAWLVSLAFRKAKDPRLAVDLCIPSLPQKPPSGPGRVYQITHDGYRLIVRRDGEAPAQFKGGALFGPRAPERA